jgi:hypothetical protein
MTPIIDIADLNTLQIDQLGRGAFLKFFSIKPTTGETELFTLRGGWCVWRKDRKENEPVNSLTVLISKKAAVDIEKLRENAVLELNRFEGAQRVRYSVVAVTETQDLSSGWVLHLEPLNRVI